MRFTFDFVIAVCRMSSSATPERARGLSSGLNVVVLGLLILPRLALPLLILPLMVLPALAEGQLDMVAKFQQASFELDVATYTDPELKPREDRVALLGLADGKTRNSFAFRIVEWSKLIDLTAAAARAQSSGGNWTVIGEMTEVGTSDASHLVISAGTGIRFALNSRKGPALTYVLASGDFARFQQALNQVKTYLKSQ